MTNIPIRDANGNLTYTKSSGSGTDVSPFIPEHYDSAAQTELQTLNSLIPSKYDNVTLTYDGSNRLSGVVFKLALVTISTLTLAYDGSGNLSTVVKS